MRFATTISLVVLVITWGITSHLAQSDAFPGPIAVGQKILQEGANGELWIHLGATFGRVLVAFGLAWAVGIAIGVALGRSDTLDRWFWPWVNTFLNMPGADLQRVEHFNTRNRNAKLYGFDHRVTGIADGWK